MKINFTKKEYRLLLDLVYLGEWMLTAHDDVPDPAKEGYEMLIQKIYSHAKELGCESLIEDSKELGSYLPTREYEEGSEIHEHIGRYNSDSFWDELIHRLTDRDVKSESRLQDKEIESAEEYINLSSPIEEKYVKEFEVHGLRRLIIRET